MKQGLLNSTLPGPTPFIRIALLSVFFVFANSTFAENLFFAGASFSGDYNNRAARYPYADKIIKKQDSNGDFAFDSILSGIVRTVNHPDVNLRFDLGDRSAGDSLSVSFSLASESVEEITWGQETLNIYRVIAQVLVFDFNERKVIANYPAMILHQELSRSRRHNGDHEKTFRKIYLDASFDGSIIQEWVRRLKQARIQPSYNNYLGIRSVNFAPELEAQIRSEGAKKSAYEREVAQMFESFLAEHHGVSLVPYTTGQAIAKHMVERFSNGTVYQFSLPDPDYTIDIRMRPFKHVSAQTRATDQYIFAAYVDLVVTLPDTEKRYLDAEFKHLNKVLLDRSEGIKVDYWNSYQTSLRALLKNISKQIKKRDRQSLAKMTKTPGIQGQLKAFHGVLEKCI